MGENMVYGLLCLCCIILLGMVVSLLWKQQTMKPIDVDAKKIVEKFAAIKEACTGEVSTLQKQIKDKEEEIEQQRLEINKLKDTQKTLNADLKCKENLARSLQTELDALKKRNTQVQNQEQQNHLPVQQQTSLDDMKAILKSLPEYIKAIKEEKIGDYRPALLSEEDSTKKCAEIKAILQEEKTEFEENEKESFFAILNSCCIIYSLCWFHIQTKYAYTQHADSRYSRIYDHIFPKLQNIQSNPIFGYNIVFFVDKKDEKNTYGLQKIGEVRQQGSEYIAYSSDIPFQSSQPQVMLIEKALIIDKSGKTIQPHTYVCSQ